MKAIDRRELFEKMEQRIREEKRAMFSEIKGVKAKDYVDLIEWSYRSAKVARMSRMSPEWGVWSAEMNREIRKKIEENDPESLELKYVFVLWVTRSQLLELNYQSRILRMGRKRKLSRECVKLKEMILTGVDLEDFNFDAATLVQQVI